MADASLAALYGHPITVNGQRCELGTDGRLSAPESAAKVLLRQAGWREEVPASRNGGPKKGGLR